MNFDPNNVGYLHMASSMNQCQSQLRHLKKLLKYSMIKMVVFKQEANILQLNTTPNAEQKLQRLQHLFLEVTGEMNVLKHDIAAVRNRINYLLGVIEIGRTTPLITSAVAAQAQMKEENL